MLDRRRVLSAVAAAGAAGLGAPAAALPVERRPSADDPLGVRRDFVVVNDRVYLNSASITTPKPLSSLVDSSARATSTTPKAVAVVRDDRRDRPAAGQPTAMRAHRVGARALARLGVRRDVG